MVTDRMRTATLTDIKRHTVTDIHFLIRIYPQKSPCLLGLHGNPRRNSRPQGDRFQLAKAERSRARHLQGKMQGAHGPAVLLNVPVDPKAFRMDQSKGALRMHQETGRDILAARAMGLKSNVAPRL